ncbi:MAG: SDR family NAD(P)-dependent oxidoreductase [Thermoguttaceae bacterium]
MKTVLLGATRGMGRALARLMAERGDRLFLLGRDAGQLPISARDLELRGAEKPVETAHCDLSLPQTFGPALDAAADALEGFDTVVLSAGMFDTQERLENDAESAERLLSANFTNTVLFCEETRKRMLAAGRGTLCVFSSVAGERGRKPIVLYGAAKAGLSAYLEGLDHKFRAAGLKTVCVKPGFVNTSMTAGLKPPPFAATAQEVAPSVLRAIDRGKPVIYTPAIWRYVMCTIRHLPRFVMRRIEF